VSVYLSSFVTCVHYISAILLSYRGPLCLCTEPETLWSEAGSFVFLFSAGVVNPFSAKSVLYRESTLFSVPCLDGGARLFSGVRLLSGDRHDAAKGSVTGTRGGSRACSAAKYISLGRGSLLRGEVVVELCAVVFVAPVLKHNHSRTTPTSNSKTQAIAPTFCSLCL
jgi:hypothetical protein